MDVAHVNNLLSRVKVKLESLDPQNEMAEIEMQQPDSEDSPNRDARMGAAKARLAHLLKKLGANRSDANHVRAYGTK
jgi:hypothetical protein